jgi:enoyl-CoA hydratase
VVVLQGAGGKSFASGADISEFDQYRGNAQEKKEYGRISQRANYWLKNLSKPVIAKIDGYCIGGGLAIALDADIRFALSHSSIAIPAAKLGLGYEFNGVSRA